MRKPDWTEVIEGCLKAPCYRNFPENGLSPYTEVTSCNTSRNVAAT